MSENAARQLVTMFQKIANAIEDNKDYLSELDGAIGDGDHGITMSIGFLAVTAEIAKMDIDKVDPAAIMSTAATAFLNAVGASTGPLYATAFRRAAKALANTATLDLHGCAAMLRAIATGIAERGKGQRGDKTMLDTWLPATRPNCSGRTCWPLPKREPPAPGPWSLRRGEPPASANARSAMSTPERLRRCRF